MSNAVTESQIVAGLERLGARDKRFIVHASLRSFGRVEGGAPAVARAVMQVGRTVLVPTFTFCPAALPAVSSRVPRNGCNYDTDRLGDEHPTAYRLDLPVAMPIGAVAEALRLSPGAVRSRHPLSSFAAIGVHAARYVERQPYDAPMLPITRMVDDDGWVLMLGTDWTSCTTVHRGEEIVGRRPFVRWALCEDGNVRAVRVGGCSDGFNAMNELVSGVRDTRVGNALLRLVSMANVLDTAVSMLRRDPLALACGSRCQRCLDAAAGGPVVG
jgi:aminoglycoside 3-N-acetyltransferase